MNTAENLSSLEQICEVDGESGGRTHPKGHLNITVLKRTFQGKEDRSSLREQRSKEGCEVEGNGE